jgi:hypothetical protein
VILKSSHHHNIFIEYKQENPIWSLSSDAYSDTVDALSFQSEELYGMTISWSSSLFSRIVIPKMYLSAGVFLAWYRVAQTSRPGIYRVLNTVTMAGLYSSSIVLCYKGGLEGVYYVDADWSKRGGVRIDKSVSFDWGVFGPSFETIPANKFSVRWRGFLRSSESGVFTFMMSVHDEARLWLGETHILDAGSAIPQRVATFVLEKFMMYPIQIEYRERAFDSRIHLM